MENQTYNQYFNLIERVRDNAYLYVAIYDEAKAILVPSQFKLLQEKLALTA